MTMDTASVLALLAAVADPDLALSQPHGWIGTADDWARGLGIAFVVLALAILAVSWGRLRRAGLTPGLKELLVLPLVVLPPAIVFFGYSHGIERSKSIGSCGSCHVMKPYLADLRNPDSSTLAATHYKNRYIQEHHCYICPRPGRSPTHAEERSIDMVISASQIKEAPRMPVRPKERHRIGRIGWIRAAVLGANDGIVSTASLVLGVATAGATHDNVLVAGVAGLVAGAMSMAAGEYVSVHSQADTEQAELELERAELKADDRGEHKELAAIYVARGLEPALAKQVAEQLMAHDALGAHARDELGISEALSARPIQAALASAGSFAVGSAMPLLVTAIAPESGLIPLVSGTSLVFLTLLGGLAARAGGAGVTVGAIRVTFWGALAMAVTAGVGALFGSSAS